MAILNNSNAISAGGYDVNNSLRFRRSASASLTRTPSSATNRRTWTWSGWIKRGLLSSTTLMDIYYANNSTALFDRMYFHNSNGTFELNGENGTSVVYNLITTQVFRDPSAWYHIVVAFDTTQATSSNRIKIYVNGNQVTAFSTSTYPSLNFDTQVNNNVTQYIGTGGAGASDQLFDGYMAEVNFIDGSAKTPSDFGETDTTTGVWKPKAYSGTYGTNGFYLKFSDIATTSGSNAGLGKDFSGNSNYWTTNNISVTSGTTYDAMTDSPTNTSATVANYAVLSPINKGTSVTLSNGNLSYSWSSAGNAVVFSTIAMTTGKWYAEWTQGTTPSLGAMYVGIGGDSNNPNHSWLGQNATEYSYNNVSQKANNGTNTTYGAAWTSGDVIGIAFDADARTLTFYKNGTSQGTAFTSIPDGNYYFGAGNNPSSTVTGNMNFGQRPFTYTPPTGYVALNTYNLPTSTIVKGNSYMDAKLYTGNGGQQTQSGLNFQPDLVWVKARSNAFDHGLANSVVGVGKYLISNSTSAEVTDASGSIIAFNSNGFGQGGSNPFGANGATYVGWAWNAGSGTNTTNTAGSITSTVSVNTTAGFSVVTYTGTLSSAGTATVGHGLGVAPKMIITKARSATSDWSVMHTSLPNWNYQLFLNATNAQYDSTANGSRSAPTSSVFTTNYTTGVNTNGVTTVAYCWAEIAGFSKFGSYTGNGSTDGPFIFLGFRPKFIITKRTDSATNSNWEIHDSSRNTYNVANLALYPNTTDAEGSQDDMDFLSNGFKLKYASANTQTNINGGTYIYAAFAENPFKNALAR